MTRTQSDMMAVSIVRLKKVGTASQAVKLTIILLLNVTKSPWTVLISELMNAMFLHLLMDVMMSHDSFHVSFHLLGSN
jgi:hypothetical protein